MIDQIDNILFYLRDSDSKKPMQAQELADKLQVSMPSFEEMMNNICNIVPAPVNRAYREVTENIEKNIKGFKGYVYWPTGVIDKAHWKDFKPASSKPAAQPIRTENSIPKVSTDTYETPVFGQSMTTDAPKQKPLISVSDYSGKSKAYQILKLIEANPAASTKLLSDLVGTDDIGNYVKSYSQRGLVVCGKNEHGKRTWSLKDGWTAEQVYETRKGGANYTEAPVKPLPMTQQAPLANQPGAQKNEVTQIPQQPQETKATGALDAQAPAAEPQGTDVHQVEKTATENNQTQVDHDHPALIKQSRYRFAYTNDRCLMIFQGKTSFPIELTSHETEQLLTFVNNQLSLLEAAV